MTTRSPEEVAGRGRWAIWSAGLLVALGAAAATAHGLFEVAKAAGTPAGIAWLYPLITDGLALVAYASSARLTGSGRRYAWAVVVLAAGLSGLAQASYLAGGVAQAPPALRFGVGAWPAVAAAIAAHLLFLIGTGPGSTDTSTATGRATGAMDEPGRPAMSNGRLAMLDAPRVQPPHAVDVQPSNPTLPAGVQPGARDGGLRRALSPRDRARTVAELRYRESGALPTVRELASLADVSRGTAANALDALRQPINRLHAVTDHREEGTQL
jgi:hypothetical protein